VGVYRVTEPDGEFDDPENLILESVRESFNWWRPKCLLRLDPNPSINDLSAHRWHCAVFTPDEELDAIRRLLAGEKLAYRCLLEGFHRQILKIAAGYMPSYWRHRGTSIRDKHTNVLFYEDLVVAGVAAMWKAALKFDLDAGNRFWTAARLPVIGAISDEARQWRRNGSGVTRLDRWLSAHPTASPEQVLRAQQRLVRRPIYHSPQEAAEGIKQFWAWGSEAEWDDDMFPTQNWRYLAEILREWYDCFDPNQLSSHRRIHQRFSDLIDRFTGGLDFGPDVGEVSRPKAPRDLLDYTERAVLQLKTGKRQVTRQKAAAYCYGIVVTPELRARALKDLEFANWRWRLRTKCGPLAAQTYPHWSTKFGQGLPEHENKQIIPAYIEDGNKWFVRYRSAAGDVLSVLECPSRHCRRKGCDWRHHQGSRTSALRSHGHNVPRQSVSLSAA